MRNIESENPLKTAREFYDTLSKGGKEDIIQDPSHPGNLKGYKSVMPDGLTITFRRYSSSDGSPAVDIVLTRGHIGPAPREIKKQKIHFVERKKDDK